MTAHAYALQIIEEHLVRCGVPEPIAKSEAPKHLAVLMAAGLVNVRSLDAVERDAQVYRLRGQRVNGEPMTAVLIGQRLTLARSKVFEALRRHQARRRAVLRLIA